MLKYLRIAVTALSLTACVLFLALWVRSYQWIDAVSWADDKYGLCILSSDYGRLMLLRYPGDSLDRPSGWRMQSYRIDELGGSVERRTNPPPRFAWWFNRHNGYLTVRTPHWLLGVAGMVVAMMPWIRPRFSLRTLLIATTLIAVVLGIVVAAL